MLAQYLELRNSVRALLRRQDGAALAEYSLLLMFIAVVAIVAVTALGGDLAARFDEIAGAL